MSKLHEILTFLRKEKGLSQKDLSSYLDITPQAYSRYENGNAEPTIERLTMIADLYNVSLDELVGRDFKQESSSMREIVLKKQIDKDFKVAIEEVLMEIVNNKEEEIKKKVFEKLNLV